MFDRILASQLGKIFLLIFDSIEAIPFTSPAPRQRTRRETDNREIFSVIKRKLFNGLPLQYLV